MIIGSIAADTVFIVGDLVAARRSKRLVLLLPGHRRCKAVLPTEVTLDGLHLFTFEPQILTHPTASPEPPA